MSIITLKDIIDEDFVNYRVPSMTLMFPRCSFKCGEGICQNSELVNMEDVQTTTHRIYMRYLNNPITKAIVIGGLEPFDSFDDMRSFIGKLRWDYGCFDPVVIYTGFYPDEISNYLMILSKFAGIIVKFGRYIPNSKSRYDEILGINLASDNQFAKKIS